MKTLVFPKPTKDVDGLLTELRREFGPVISVASDPRKTYIYVEDGSELDMGQCVNEWEDIPILRVESTNPADEDGVPSALADGKEIQTLVVQKTTGYGDLIQDATKITASVSHGGVTAQQKLRLKKGVGSITLGPTTVAGDVIVEVQDARKRMTAVSIRVKFASTKADPEKKDGDAAEVQPDPAPLPIKTDEATKAGLWEKLKRILGIS